MIKLLKEPLLHFLLLGGLLFVGFQMVAKDSTDALIVSQQRIMHLSVLFEKTWKRPPTTAELEVLIEKYVVEEMYYREALSLGLEQDDGVIRRRLQQKMEFIILDLSEVMDPSDEELTTYLQSNQHNYQTPATFSFKQVFINPAKHASAQQSALVLLENAQRVEPVGDSTLLPAQLNLTSADRIDNTFGDGFAQALSDTEIGQWHGPIVSSYGLHLVFVSEKQQPRMPALSEIKSMIVRDWLHEKQLAMKKKLDENLRIKYQVIIESVNTDAVNKG